MCIVHASPWAGGTPMHNNLWTYRGIHRIYIILLALKGQSNSRHTYAIHAIILLQVDLKDDFLQGATAQDQIKTRKSLPIPNHIQYDFT